MTKNLIINEELKNLLPPLSAEEFAGLEADILKHGCLSPLIVWNDILVDGHHRCEICWKHEIPFAVNSIVLDSLDEAKFWTWQHQKHRRNLTAYHRAELALKLKDVIMAKAKERQRGGQGGVLLPQNSAEGKETRQELAEISSVSHDTVSRAEYIASHADEETKQKLRSGEKGTSINKEYNRLRAEKNAAKTNVDTEMNSELDDDYASQFRPGSLPTKKYVGETQLKPIPRDRPDILIANLIAFFPQDFVPNAAREIFRMLHNRYGKEVTKPLAMEFYNEYARRK